MANSGRTPYEILGVETDINYVALRPIYRTAIHDYKSGKITARDFRCKVRAYETLSDFEKRKRYDSTKKWISDLPLAKYTVQQLAAESSLQATLEQRLKGASLSQMNAQDPVTGHTALYCAARAGHVEGVKFLTKNGAESDLPQRTGSTALHVAAFYGNADAVRCLLENGADYRITNSGKSTAEREAFNDEVKQVFVEMKKTPYVRVAANEIDWFSKNLLDQHIDEQYYLQRQTLLHCASKKGYFDLVRLLVERFSAYLDITDVNQNSALHLAAYGGHLTIVEYLLSRGSNPTLKNQWGTTAEEEGVEHGRNITRLFQGMREKDIFEMARQGTEWWFHYYFNDASPDAVDSKGTSVLYHACRYGQYTVAKWLLGKGANVNARMSEAPRSTALHTAKYHGFLTIIELLLEYDADVTIKNDFKVNALDEQIEETVDQVTSKKINELVREYRENLKSQKLIDVHVYLNGADDGKPVTKIQLQLRDTYSNLVTALPSHLANGLDHFSVARRALKFESIDTTVISAVCRARHMNSRYLDLPICLTLHKEPATGYGAGHVIRAEHKVEFRTLIKQFGGKATSHRYLVKSSSPTDKQMFKVDDLIFTFSGSPCTQDVEFQVEVLFQPDPAIFGLPGCIYLFETTVATETMKLNEHPLVSLNKGQQDTNLYTLLSPCPYWFRSNTRKIRLPTLEGFHAIIRHPSIIRDQLTIPADVLMSAALNQPLSTRYSPVPCTCLVLQVQDTVQFPEKAYHGTSIFVVQSILMDGLVVPGTVTSAGKLINPPRNHIARGRAAFNVPDFAAAVFLSPSVHYSSDSVYAIPFSDGDRTLIPVLECSVRKHSYRSFKSTVPTYKAHPQDDLATIEWRVTDPTNIVINAVLFIPQNISLQASKEERMKSLEPELDSL